METAHRISKCCRGGNWCPDRAHPACRCCFVRDMWVRGSTGTAPAPSRSSWQTDAKFDASVRSASLEDEYNYVEHFYARGKRACVEWDTGRFSQHMNLVYIRGHICNFASLSPSLSVNSCLTAFFIFSLVLDLILSSRAEKRFAQGRREIPV
jgi:hypothetical protein